ncbi:MAG: hypothetical protein C0501_28360 [Isosphaera sp.]|nr:hypothetical protein [Isosphaera sp.]
MNTVINLEKYKGLFKDAAAFEQFAAKLEEAAGNSAMVFCGEELYGAFVSPEEAEERLRSKIIRRLAKNPALLDSIKDSLEDEVVE